MRLQTFGGPRLHGPDGPELAGRRKELALLTYIARQSPRPVGRVELATLLWGDKTDDRARASLRQALLQLRRVLGDALTVDPERAVLAPEALDLDVGRFEREVAAGEYEAAVARWEGEFLAGTEEAGGEGFRVWLESERERLRRKLAYAFEALVAACESRGDWRQGATWARQWADALPYDERAHLRLAESLHLAGRPDEALAICAEFTARLRGTFDTAPSPAFLRLTERLARDRSAVAGATRMPASAGVLSPDLVGRDAEFEALIAAWREIQSGTSPVVISGDDGLGKTRLLEEFLRWLQRSGHEALVLAARPYAADEQQAWATARELLAPLRDAPGLAGASPRTLAELSRLVPALREQFRDLPAPTDDDAALADAVWQALGEVASEVPVFVVADDLAAADPESRKLFLKLARRLPAPGLLVVCTVRASDRVPGMPEALRALSARWLRLRPLGAHEVEAVISSMLQMPASERRTFATRLAEETGGNPFFIVELVRALVDDGALAPDADGEWRFTPDARGASVPLPASVRDALAVRMAHLGDDARAALAAAAVLGSPMRRDALAASTNLPPAMLSAALDELLARRLLRTVADDGDALEFTHRLVQRVANDALYRSRPGEEPPRGARPRRWWAIAAAATLAVMLMTAAVVHFTTADPLDDSLVAVAPVDVLGPELVVWREGIVDLLSRGLDGAGPLRTVAPTVVVRHFAGRADAASADALGRSTGARLVVHGALVRTSADSVRLTLSLRDAQQRRSAFDLTLHSSDERIAALVDSATVLLLHELGRTRPIAAVRRRAAIPTRSLPALKAYLLAEQFYRRAAYDSARVYSERAAGLDTTFALAYWRLWKSILWQREITVANVSDGDVTSYALRAGRLNRGLHPRDSLLIAADSLVAVIAADWARQDDPSRVLRFFALRRETVHRYPDDPEAWFELGQSLLQWGSFVGARSEEILQAYDRAIALDPSFAPAYYHAVDLALELRGPTAARSYVERYLALMTNPEQGSGLRLLMALTDPRARDAEVRALLDTLPATYLGEAVVAAMLWPDSAETAVRVGRVLHARPFHPRLHPDTTHTRYIFQAVLTQRGRLKEAFALGDTTMRGQLVELALHGAVPPARAQQVFEGWRESNDVMLMLRVLPWWSARRDTGALRETGRRCEAIARDRRGADLWQANYGRYCMMAVDAYLSLVRGDTATAVPRFTALPLELCAWCTPDRLTAVQLLAATGRLNEAGRLLERGTPASADIHPRPSDVLWVLERGRVAERRGDRAVAERSYRYVADVWLGADPALRRHVDEARAGLARIRR